MREQAGLRRPTSHRDAVNGRVARVGVALANASKTVIAASVGAELSVPEVSSCQYEPLPRLSQTLLG